MADLVTGGSTTTVGLSGSATVVVLFWHVSLLRPASVPISTAVLVVSAQTASGTVDVRVQASTTDSFGTTLKDEVLTAVPGDGVSERSTTLTGLSDGATYYWRARVEPSGAPVGPWVVGQFSVLMLTGTANEYTPVNIGWGLTPSPDALEYLPINIGVRDATTGVGAAYAWENIGLVFPDNGYGAEYLPQNIVAPAPRPHLWFLSPTQGRPNDGFDLVCFGVGDLQSTYGSAVERYDTDTNEWVGVSIVSWQTFPARPAAYTEDRELHTLSVIPPRRVYAYHTAFPGHGLMGSPWRVEGSSWVTSDGSASPATGTEGRRIASISGLSDGQVTLVLGSLDACLAFRVRDVNNFLFFDPTTRFVRQVVGGTVSNVGSVRPLPSTGVTHRALAGGVATLTVGPHDFLVGESVTVAGVASPFTGTFTLTGVGETTISYALAGSVAPVASGGTVTRGIRVGDSITVSMLGSTISISRGSASMGSVSTGSFQTEVRHGLAALSGTPVFSQFTWLSGEDPTTPIDQQHTRIGVLIPSDALPPGFRVRIRTEEA